MTSVGRRRIAFGVDEPGPLSEAVRAILAERGDLVVVIEGEAWTDVGLGVAEAVASGEADLGVVMCWTGTGVSIAANKVRGVRAALCMDADTALGARRWNDANVLALSMRLVSEPIAREILDAFLEGVPDPDELPTIRSLES